jgi:hypothetical protein
MLEQDIQDFGPDAARTVSALYSNPNLPRELNKPLYTRNVSQILAATSPKDWAEFEKNIRPYEGTPGAPRYGLNGQQIDTVPIVKDGIYTTFKNGVPSASVIANAPQAQAAMAAATEGVKPMDVYDPARGVYKASTVAEAVGGGLATKPGPGVIQTEEKTAQSAVAKQSNFPTAEKGINAYVEQSKFLENQIDQAIALAKQRGTTGLIGSQAAKIQGTPAFNLQQLLAPIQSGVAFDALKDLKANDSSLGQIAVKEFEALAGSKGSVNQGQTDAQLISSLNSLKERLATGRDRVTGEYYNIYKDFALTPERIAPIVEQAIQNPLNVPPGFQVRAVGQEQYLVGPNKFFQKIK